MTEREMLEELNKLRAENSSLKAKINKDLTEHSLLGFNQKTMEDKGIKMPGHYLFILKKLMDMRGYNGMETEIIDDQKAFWLKRGLLCEIFPVYIKTIKSHDNVLMKLEELGLIKKHQLFEKGGRTGSYSYISITDLAESLKNDYIQVVENTKEKIQPSKKAPVQLPKKVSEGSPKLVSDQLPKKVKQRPCINDYPIQKETHYTYKGKISTEDIETVSNLLLVHDYTPVLKAQIISDTALIATIMRERKKDKIKVNKILKHCNSITTGKKVKGSLINYLNGKELPSLN